MEKLKNKNQSQVSNVINIKKPRKISSAKLIILFFILAVLLLPAILVLADTFSEIYSSPPNSVKIIVRSDGGCRQIQNNSGVNYFIPNRTVAEEQSFENAASRLNVNVLNCACTDNVDCLTSLYCSGLNARCVKMDADNPACAGYVDRTSCQYNGCQWSVLTAGICSGEGCVRNCVDKNCGADGCGSVCGYCSTGQECSASGVCVSTCGNGSCQAIYGEDCSSCAIDCGSCGGEECYDDSYCPPGQYCSGLIAYCQGDWFCGDYTNMSDCGYNGCDWALQQSGTCSY